MRRVAVALVHSPVVDKNGREIAAALTPTDLHDLARSARTYGVERLWIVTPLQDQQALARRMLTFWRSGVGAGYNPNRGQALDLVAVVDDLGQVLAGQTEAWARAGVAQRPFIWATSAKNSEGRLDFSLAKEYLDLGRPALILFGTAWGLTPAVLAGCDGVLAPLGGAGEYNHLSVRSAAAVILDRLLGRSEGD